MAAIKATEISTNDALSILAIGGSGTGKSIAMCSCPGPVLNINMDKRIKSIIEYYKGNPILDQLYFESPEKFDDLDKIVDDLEGYCPYKTVILDPVTNLSVNLIQYSLSLRGVERGDKKSRKKGVINLAEVEDYGVETQGMQEIIFNLKLAQQRHGFNLIFVAHLITINHYKVGGQMSHTTQDILTAGRKAAAFIPTQFDEIYFFRSETDEVNKTSRYFVRTYNDGEIPARTSYIDMPPEIEWTKSRNFYGFISQFFGKKKDEASESQIEKEEGVTNE